MDITLNKKPKNAIIIEGFPGFGLVGTIATEFLMDHLECEQIGRIWFDKIPAMVAIHENKVVEPIGIFYNKKYNAVLIHGITSITGSEWKIADAIVNIAKQVGAKEIISLEGVGSAVPSLQPSVYYYTNNKKTEEKLKNLKLKPLKEGIIMGVTGSVMLKAEKLISTCFFVETQSNLPDSKAAAKIVEILDKYLGFKIDYKPLLAEAEKFEEKLKGLMQKGQKATQEQRKKQLSYVG